MTEEAPVSALAWLFMTFLDLTASFSTPWYTILMLAIAEVIISTRNKRSITVETPLLKISDFNDFSDFNDCKRF